MQQTSQPCASESRLFRPVAALITLLIVACVADERSSADLTPPLDPPPTMESEAAERVYNGVADNTRAVGQLVQDLGGGSTRRCTATLLCSSNNSSNIVLTAAHCDKFTWFRGGNQEAWVSVSDYASYFPPNVATTKGADGIRLYKTGAVTSLGVPVSDLFDVKTGDAFKLIGFGMPYVGSRAAGTVKLSLDLNSIFETAAGPSVGCSGDSGGPLLRNSKIVGVLYSSTQPAGKSECGPDVTNMNVRVAPRSPADNGYPPYRIIKSSTNEVCEGVAELNLEGFVSRPPYEAYQMELSASQESKNLECALSGSGLDPNNFQTPRTASGEPCRGRFGLGKSITLVARTSKNLDTSTGHWHCKYEGAPLPDYRSEVGRTTATAPLPRGGAGVTRCTFELWPDTGVVADRYLVPESRIDDPSAWEPTQDIGTLNVSSFDNRPLPTGFDAWNCSDGSNQCSAGYNSGSFVKLTVSPAIFQKGSRRYTYRPLKTEKECKGLLKPNRPSGNSVCSYVFSYVDVQTPPPPIPNPTPSPSPSPSPSASPSPSPSPQPAPVLCGMDKEIFYCCYPSGDRLSCRACWGEEMARCPKD